MSAESELYNKLANTFHFHQKQKNNVNFAVEYMTVKFLNKNCNISKLELEFMVKSINFLNH